MTSGFSCDFVSEPGSAASPNEDFVLALDRTVIVLDGLTTRTATGCRHGTPWFVRHLATELAACNEAEDLRDALAAAIEQTAHAHQGTCDLGHPGSPAAAVAIVRVDAESVRYLALGDVTIVLRGEQMLRVVCDDRINSSAPAERALADALPADSPDKPAALVRMKHAELRERNIPGRYWVAAVDPAAAAHSLVAAVPRRSVAEVAVLTDGAARPVVPFGTHTWSELLDLLAERGSRGLISAVRALERGDGTGSQWPRNKVSDDATAVLIRL